MRRLFFFVALTIGLLALLAAPALASAQTFVVHPSHGNDTKAIQAAFNAAVKAGPGSTVQLSAGHFYTNTIFVSNFRGTFKGAGEGKTTIDCLRGLDPSLPGVTLMPGQNFTFLLGFDGGDVRVSDMSFDVTAFFPVDEQSNGGRDYLEVDVLVTGNASSAFDRVAFEAGSGSDSGLNTDEGLIITGVGPNDANGNPLTYNPINGVESVRDCAFNPVIGVQANGLTHGALTISGSVFDCGFLGCLLDDSSASQITVSHNQMQNSSGECVVLYQGWQAADFGDASLLPPLPAPHFLICDNHLLASGSASAFFAEDDSLLYGARNRLRATVAGNKLDLDTTTVGIGEFATRDFCVFDNRISGSALTGMYLGDDYGGPDGTTLYPVSDWKIIANDLHSLSTSMASIVLGNGSSHCLVVGGPPPTTVLDEGTGNILINVTPVSDPPAAAAAPMNSLKQVKQLKEMMRP